MISEGLEKFIEEELKREEEEEKREEEEEKRLPRNQIVSIPLDKLEDFPADQHPFQPASEERLEELRQDIVQNGILAPLIVRQVGEEKYQILAGHNRKRAAELARYDDVPCIIKDVDDVDAINIMLSDNLTQRKDLLPSEKAFAYKLKLDNMKRSAGRPKNSAQVGPNFGGRSNQELADQSPDGKTQIQRYIRLTYLTKDLLQKVDEQAIGLVIGVALSYLSPEAQQVVYQYYFVDHKTQHISQAMAEELRRMDEEITVEVLDRMAREQAEGQRKFRVVKVQMKNLRQYFQPDVTKEEAEKIIEEAVAFYYNNRQLNPANNAERGDGE